MEVAKEEMGLGGGVADLRGRGGGVENGKPLLSVTGSLRPTRMGRLLGDWE